MLAASARARSFSSSRSCAASLYGLITYAVMNWLVVPLRFDTPLPPKPLSIATQLFAHIVLVGIPMALDRRALSLLEPLRDTM